MTTDIHTQLGLNQMAICDVDNKSLGEQVDILIDRMNTFGIEKSVLVPSNAYDGTDLYMKACAIYPDRLFSACTIFPRPIDDARNALIRYKDQGCVSLVMDENLYYPGDPAADTLVRAAVEEDIAVYFQSRELRGENLSFVDRSSLMHPQGRFVVLSMGGLFSFPNVIPLLARQNIWLETSFTLVRLVESPLRVYLDALVQDGGIRKLVFGSGHHTDYGHLQASLNMIDLNYEQQRVITKENAYFILGVGFTG